MCKEQKAAKEKAAQKKEKAAQKQKKRQKKAKAAAKAQVKSKKELGLSALLAYTEAAAPTDTDATTTTTAEQEQKPREQTEPEREPNLLWHSEYTWQKKKARKEGPKPLPPEYTINRNELETLLKTDNTNTYIIDIREPIEWQYEPPLPNACSVPAETLVRSLGFSEQTWQTKFNQSKPTKESNIIIYCSPEDRSWSIAAVNLFRKNGYTRVRELINGQREWNKYNSSQFSTPSQQG